MRTNPIPDGWNESCAPVPRCRFSAVESHPEEVSVGVPSIIGANQLETLRWMYRSQKGRDGLPKVVKGICPRQNFERSFLVINHYLGDWNVYSFRDDSRKGGEKSRQVWEFRTNETEGGSADQIRPWIGGFVAAMGEERAFLLLKDAGLPQNFKVFNKNEWRVKKSAVHSYLKNGLDPQLIDFLDQHAG
ncbi:predicted protein [Phaeodactylum tricornutum CCAP 1055/1]|uniref:Uncharacterized protein n=1 Tax=Phaeodactylum tricornutum (strain CCAP 1055/1) TaxID=556484 RepID=B7G6S5_PHATC|nr:predicted protein [Phaeodactylum tricornutum CCAP 1055/1]EEC45518.1 predicted protein [Phaeodactylum tricornutum CCAP 1055/1]|eukprot:XP_002182782.1 predicted protein [Phaeodactylum tricornutum CCAP 1055/1]